PSTDSSEILADRVGEAGDASARDRASVDTARMVSGKASDDVWSGARKRIRRRLDSKRAVSVDVDAHWDVVVRAEKARPVHGPGVAGELPVGRVMVVIAVGGARGASGSRVDDSQRPPDRSVSCKAGIVRDGGQPGDRLPRDRRAVGGQDLSVRGA